MTTTPTTQARGGEQPDDQLDEDAQARRRAARPGGGPGGRRADAAALGDVHAEHEAEEEPDDRDDEEADDAEGDARPLGGGGDAGLLEPAAGHGVLDDRAGDEEAARRRRRRSSRCRSPISHGPDQDRRRGSAAPPGRTGTMMPTRPTRIASATTTSSAAHGRHPPTASPDGVARTAGRRRPRTVRSGAVGRRVVGQRSVVGCDGRGVGELVGLVVHVDRDLAELVAVLAGVVGAEEQLAAGLELDAEVGLGSAAVAAVRGAQRGGTGGNGSSSHRPHFSSRRVSGQRSGGTQRFPPPRVARHVNPTTGHRVSTRDGIHVLRLPRSTIVAVHECDAVAGHLGCRIRDRGRLFPS